MFQCPVSKRWFTTPVVTWFIEPGHVVTALLKMTLDVYFLLSLQKISSRVFLQF